MIDTPLSLNDGLRLSGLSAHQLWMRYVSLGGNTSIEELRVHLESRSCSDAHEHNLIAQALNEAFSERGHDHPVAYAHLYHRE